MTSSVGEDKYNEVMGKDSEIDAKRAEIDAITREIYLANARAASHSTEAERKFIDAKLAEAQVKLAELAELRGELTELRAELIKDKFASSGVAIATVDPKVTVAIRHFNEEVNDGDEIDSEEESWSMTFGIRFADCYFEYRVELANELTREQWRALANGDAITRMRIYQGNGEGTITLYLEDDTLRKMIRFVAAPGGAGGDVVGTFQVPWAAVAPHLSAALADADSRKFVFRAPKLSSVERARRERCDTSAVEITSKTTPVLQQVLQQVPQQVLQQAPQQVPPLPQ